MEETPRDVRPIVDSRSIPGVRMEPCAVVSERQVDRNLIEACREGDRDSFRLVFEAYKDRVYSVALHFFSGDRSAAHDVSQQIFLKLFSKIGQFQYQSEFATWLYRMTVNTCIDEQRRTRRLVPIEGEMGMASNARSQEKLHLQREVATEVRIALGALSPKLRLPLLLKYLEGLSYEEISKVLGCSMGTVASRLNRGHKQLARKLSHLRGVYTSAE
jgi:RNA polymerase sigma-70 factor (ECF subfamily)